MLKERLRKLFESYEPPIRQLINEVGELEQQYLSMKLPRGIRQEIDEIITRIAEEELRRIENEEGR